MISEDLGALIRGNFQHIPTKEQEYVIDLWCRFLLNRNDDCIFLLKGYAGTGKTSLVGALVRTMKMLKQRVVLLAPTGRAAKVMGGYAETTAGTIHRQIYRQKTFGEERFTAAPNLKEHSLYIVDEASMIANEGLSGSVFGDGRLLDDLVHYVYSCQGCRLILIGDTAQLPPVGEVLSPALEATELGGYGLDVTEVELTQVEFQIMEYFISNAGKALKRSDILKHVWGTSYVGEEKIVDVNIRRLRMKIEDEPSSPHHIVTVWGVGYRWDQ